MNLRQLRYFVAVAEQENFGKAAHQLRIAQPALSRQISQLENELKVPLFVRHARGARLTDQAKILLDRARHVLRYLEQTKHDVTAGQATASGPVVLGLQPLLALRLGPPLLAACLSQLQQVRLRLIEEYSPSLTHMLINGQVDLAILNEPLDISRLFVQPLVSEDVYLIGRPGPLFQSSTPLEARDLAGLPFILTRFEKAGIRYMLEAAATQAGVPLNLIAEVDSILVVKEMVRRGLGYAAHVADSVDAEVRRGELALRPIRGLKLTRILARSRERPPSWAALEIDRLIMRTVVDLVREKEWTGACAASGKPVDLTTTVATETRLLAVSAAASEP